MENLTGKNAIITGAGKGIGKTVALALAAEGVNVGLIARTESDLQKVAAEIKAAGVKAALATADMTNIHAVVAAVDQIKSELGPIDILINNAGTATFGGFMDLQPEQWEQIIKVNLFGVYYATRAVLPQMMERKSGDIVNIASTAGLRGAPTTSAYTASKAALIGMGESLMLEVRKHNIRVTTLNPSTVATELAVELKLTDGNPEKVMQPEDVAELIIAGLKLNKRVFLKDAAVYSTNP
jgi:3-oxoacyl-[acyl-carrier protein] reductase